ncbi:insulin-like growth factor I [Drosophila grimshawi]|nr:insulin-like growth factor I [Drosophila grimshawi]
MIYSPPSSSLLPLLATVVCVAFGLSLVAGAPISITPEDVEVKHRCSKELAETINFICQGRTVSLGQLYPHSFGNRNKRFSPDEIFYRPLQNGPIHECCLRPCGYTEMYQYCAPLG